MSRLNGVSELKQPRFSVTNADTVRRAVQAHMWREVGRLTVALAATVVAASAALASDARELGRVTAKAAIVVDSQTGEVLFARNPTLPVPPASTTKLLTALIALRQLPPDVVLPVSAYASSMPPSKAWLKKDSLLTARDLLYALLLRSANDASVVIAEGIAGSVPGFATLMNATARSLGAVQSNFVTPNGLPAANHYSTARDMAQILRGALRVSGMREILSTRTAVIHPQGTGRTRIALRSTNRLLWRDDLSVIGKTGWTRQAKRCFVGAASANGREVIVSVLGSSDLWSDVEILASYGLGEQAPSDWRDRAAWQQAAASRAPLGTAWSRPSDEDDALPAVVAPPRRAAEPRTLASIPPTSSFAGRAKKSAAARASQPAQGDSGEVARSKLRYSLHLGAFRSKVRADQLRKDVAKRGYRAQVEPAGGMYRVSIPSFASRDAARQAARKLGRLLRVEPVIVASK
jgi:D-alanyl-D-alanine carboxypeptidase (penicillin-binding protein 5/6)